MRTKATSFCFMMFVLLVVCGCRSEGPSVAVTNPDVSLPYDTVIVLDKTVTDWTAGLPWEKQSKIAIDRNVRAQTPTGMLQVEIAVRNRTDHPLRLDVQTKFFSIDGSQIDESAKETLILHRQETKAYTSSSLRKSAAKYRVEIGGAE